MTSAIILLYSNFSEKSKTIINSLEEMKIDIPSLCVDNPDVKSYAVKNNINSVPCIVIKNNDGSLETHELPDKLNILINTLFSNEINAYQTLKQIKEHQQMQEAELQRNKDEELLNQQYQLKLHQKQEEEELKLEEDIKKKKKKEKTDQQKKYEEFVKIQDSRNNSFPKTGANDPSKQMQIPNNVVKRKYKTNLDDLPEDDEEDDHLTDDENESEGFMMPGNENGSNRAIKTGTSILEAARQLENMRETENKKE